MDSKTPMTMQHCNLCQGRGYVTNTLKWCVKKTFCSCDLGKFLARVMPDLLPSKQPDVRDLRSTEEKYLDKLNLVEWENFTWNNPEFRWNNDSE